MNGKKIGGMILVVVGLGLAYTGYQMSQSIGGQLTSAFQGAPGDDVTLRYIAAAICVALGGFLAK